DSGAVPVDDALYNAAAITKRAAFTALIRWQKWFNSLPLCIRELRKSRPLCHTSIMLEHRPTIRRHALVATHLPHGGGAARIRTRARSTPRMQKRPPHSREAGAEPQEA